MITELLTRWLRQQGGTPCFRIYGKSRRERDWRMIDVFATTRRDRDSRWPILWRGTCTTWTDCIISVGWDFATSVLHEQRATPASRQFPVVVAGGRMRDEARRHAAGISTHVSATEVLAHECGHTHQAIRWSALYLPVVGSVTLFREGRHWWNHFENEASADGVFGGIVTGSVSAELLARASGREGRK